MNQRKLPALLILLDALTLAAVAGSLLWVLFFTPREAVMGDVQKIFYFHVSSAWVGMLGFLVAFIAGWRYLRTGNPRWDAAGLSGVEIGMVFTLLAIGSGSIWARPVWNTWWTWDPRLTTAFIMALIYAAYLILRRSIEEVEKQRRYSAVYAIVGFISVPFTFVSIRIFRSIHPVVFAAGAGSMAFNMSPRMAGAFAFALVAFTLLFITFFWHRFRLALAQQALAEKYPGEEENQS